MHTMTVVLLTVWLGALVSQCGCATSYDRMRTRATDAPAAGMAVIDEAGVLDVPLGPVVEDVLAWWSFRYPARAAELRTYLARGTIIVVARDACPMPSDPWYPPVRPIWAETRDNVTRVCWSRATEDRFPRSLAHEIGHMAIDILWRELPGDDHAVMAVVEYPWK
jgi:hypothetical protein